MRARLQLWLWAAWSLVGCNAILGIEEPIGDNLLYDSGVVAVPTDDPGTAVATAPDAAVAAGSGGAQATQVDSEGAGPVDEKVWPRWPMPNPKSSGLPNAQSYQMDPNDDLVTDQVTHLQWQQYPDARTFTWKEATAYCLALTLAGGRFRLPTRIELLSIVDFSAPQPPIDGSAFPETPAEPFWTSSTFAGEGESRWVVNFGPGTGYVSSSEPGNKYRVRCVR